MNDSRIYIIAEVGPNHNGKFDLAMEMIEKIAKTGVDAIKFQLTTPELLYSRDSFKALYQEENDSSKSPMEMSKKNQLTKEDHIRLYERCKSLNVDYICTAFDVESLLFLDTHTFMPYFKIASGEIFALDILDYISKRNKPVILSTGMATYSEVKTSIDLINRNFFKDITILHCISNYPARFEEVNLNNILELKRLFNYPVGFSDHTVGNDCAIASVALGVRVIEKHVTLDKNAEGPDHKASIDIQELESFVKGIRNVEKAMGTMQRSFSPQQLEISKVARKSLVTKRKILKGEILSAQDIVYKRPGIGFLPIEEKLVIGQMVLRDIDQDKVIRREDLSWL